MRNFIYLTFICILGLIFISCGSVPKNETTVENEDAVEVVEETVVEEPQNFDDEVVDVDEEVIDVKSEAELEDEEYIRSTNNLSSEETVTKEEFADDKAEILRIISELQEIMDEEDTEAWLTYIAPESIKYYSTPANIRKAQKKLPNKAIILNGIGDYFKYVFIPSRKRSKVEEIRYISKTNIKAVDVKDDGSIIVYYQFVKINNKWLVHIPKL